MNHHQSDDWSWFWDLVKPLRTPPREGMHPSRAVLDAYVRGRLTDAWQVGARSLDQAWTLTEVSQHTLTCTDCAQQVALMRRLELGRVALWREMWHDLPRMIRAHLGVYVCALFVLFAVNVSLVMLPPPMAARPCVLSGEIQPATPQMSNGSLKLEGVNKPVKPPSSFGGACLPVPAPRPFWQTWWIGWIFLLWTLALGLHIVWDWAGRPSPMPRRTATTALVGFAPVFL